MSTESKFPTGYISIPLLPPKKHIHHVEPKYSYRRCHSRSTSLLNLFVAHTTLSAMIPQLICLGKTQTSDLGWKQLPIDEGVYDA